MKCLYCKREFEKLKCRKDVIKADYKNTLHWTTQQRICKQCNIEIQFNEQWE